MKTALATFKAMSDMKDLSVDELTVLADCYSHPPANSPGAKFLLRVRDSFLAAYAKHSEFATLVNDFRRISLHVADFPEHQLKEKWQVFVDLGAWEEDVERQSAASTMNDRATQTLSRVAERLLYSLYEDLREEIRRLSS